MLCDRDDRKIPMIVFMKFRPYSAVNAEAIIAGFRG